jgi:glycosyltransferase involved in cell wall biosynthesis
VAEICIIIPALNEEKSISQVLGHLPQGFVSETVVVDNNSTDSTLSVASAAGATVLVEKLRGYGAACLKGINYLKARIQKPDIVIFLDADYSDFPEEALLLVKPIMDEDIDFVIGNRSRGKQQKGALKWHQAAGNRIATTLIELFYHQKYSDLGPFRAIKFSSLVELGMEERTFGWTAEMQIKAAKHKLTCREVPVSYRPRIGTSKISGTLGGSLLAGLSILAVIIKNL